LVIRKTGGNSGFTFSYSDGTEFVVDPFGTSVSATWPSEATLDDTATYLLGPVMGFVLLLRGIHCLHGSAVTVGERAIALVGPAGSGKSTTAAAFAGLGYRVLSEDVTALVPNMKGFDVLPGYPCIRLWPESVGALFGTPDALPLLTPNWDKRFLELDSEQFQAKPLPLAAIYVIGERSEDPASPWVGPMAAAEAMIFLTGNSYVPYLKSKAARAGEFELLGRVVSNIPVRRVVPHADPARIGRLCEVILADYHGRATPGDSRSAMRERERV
jgi:energy-coupling factor transporter ATP-binding protein EcfA2